MVPSSSRMFLARCVDVFVEDLFMFPFVSFRFKAKESLQRYGDVCFDILITSTGACLSLSFDTFRNFNRRQKIADRCPLHKQ